MAGIVKGGTTPSIGPSLLILGSVQSLISGHSGDRIETWFYTAAGIWLCGVNIRDVVTLPLPKVAPLGV